MRKCAPILATLTYLVGPVTTVHIPCVLGSDTGRTIQVIYNWTPYHKIGNTLLGCFWVLIVLETLQLD